MPKTTRAALSAPLKAPEQHGLVRRVRYESMPPKVAYTLGDIENRILPHGERVLRVAEAYHALVDGLAAPGIPPRSGEAFLFVRFADELFHDRFLIHKGRSPQIPNGRWGQPHQSRLLSMQQRCPFGMSSRVPATA